jgi:putative transposase
MQKNKLIGPMIRAGNCWDNTIAESFLHSLKVELVQQEQYNNRVQARKSIFQYIDGYYNPKRIHSSIHYVAPNVLEYACIYSEISVR